jgi:sulfonate transport system permease protein
MATVDLTQHRVASQGQQPHEQVIGPVETPDDGADLRPPRFLGAKTHRPAIALAIRASVPVLLLLLWWWGTKSGWFSERVFSSPGQVFSALKTLFDTGQLGDYIAASAQRLAIGVGFGLAVAVTFGMISGLSALGEELVDPTMQAVRAVPFLALTPLFVAWFGVGQMVKYVIIGYAAALPMYIYTYAGVRNVDRKIVEAARGFGLHGFRLVTRVIVPSAAPNLLMALRISMATSLLGLIAAEQINATAGIGYLVTLAQEYFRTDYMILCFVIYACLGILIDLFVRLLERLIMPWRKQVGLR